MSRRCCQTLMVTNLRSKQGLVILSIFCAFSCSCNTHKYAEISSSIEPTCGQWNEQFDSTHNASYCEGFLYKELDNNMVFVYYVDNFYQRWRGNESEMTDTIFYALRFSNKIERQYRFCTDVHIMNYDGGTEQTISSVSRPTPLFCRVDSQTVRAILKLEDVHVMSGRDSLLTLNKTLWVDFVENP
jgi:hypothetical protein